MYCCKCEFILKIDLIRCVILSDGKSAPRTLYSDPDTQALSYKDILTNSKVTVQVRIDMIVIGGHWTRADIDIDVHLFLLFNKYSRHQRTKDEAMEIQDPVS